MNRISRRSATEAAEALLEAGRTQPVLNYDVEVGLARHHDWLRSEAPMPEWASTSVNAAAKSFVSVVVKTLVSAVLIGAVGVAAWRAQGGSQPSAADIKLASPSSERPQVASNVSGVTASEAEIAHTPIPVSDPGLPSEQPARRTVRDDVSDKRAARVQRAHKQLVSARAATARSGERQSSGTVARASGVEPPRSAGDRQMSGTVARASGVEPPRSAGDRQMSGTVARASGVEPPRSAGDRQMSGTVARASGVEPPRSAGDRQMSGTVARASGVEPPRSAGDRQLDSPGHVIPAARATSSPSEDANVERATRRDVVATPERKPIAAAQSARPEPAPRAQGPGDLVEMQEVATAEQLLQRSPARALALVRQGDQRFAHGYFQQERAYIAIMALIRLGRLEEARARGASFAKQFPALPYGARIRSALEAEEAHKTAAPSAATRGAAR
jgi:hypothetical protein